MSSDAGDGRQLSAGIIVVRAADDGFRYLLLRAYRHWDFPKGRVEPGETPLAAAWRETEEETGLARLAFRWGESYFETEPYGTRARGGDRSREGTGPSVGGRGGKIARYYVACTDLPRVVLGVNPQLGRPEHHEFRWVGYGAARVLLVERVRAALDWARRTIGDPSGTAD